jgi:uncharacterized membrane protein
MLVCPFEHRVFLLADRGLRARLPAPALTDVAAAMTATLRRGDGATAFLAGIERLEQQVRALGFTGGAGANVLPDHLEPGPPGGR